MNISKTGTITIRQERPGDSAAVLRLVERAFADVPESDHREQFLVERLHRSSGFVPRLSLVAEAEDKGVVGYILLTEVEIVSERGAVTTLAVAPLAVLPESQGRGIGGRLVEEAHRRAAALGYGSAVLLGHKDYYPRLGYREAARFGIRFPFDAPSECCLAIELRPDALAKARGTVRYPEAFFG